VILLTLPTPADAADAADYIAEHLAHSEPDSHGNGGLFIMSYEAWLSKTLGNMRRETVAPGLVPATTFFARRACDGRLLGTLQIRHELNEYLLQSGGHIGYGVRPTERRKGYATQMLRLALTHCQTLGISRALITCNKWNEASARTIGACGGILENEIIGDDNEPLQRYWITL